MARRVVIGYDGSDEAQRAVEFAARTVFAECALVVNVFQDPSAAMVAGPIGAPPPMPSQELEAELERSARAVAEEGAERARAAGFEAMSAVRRGGGSADVARVLNDVAESYGAELIVVGHAHASWLEGALLGSVCVSAVREERCPVLVVPA